eukprot:CAMPEP_0197023210 /NCGR_PEP_ID=MMETSP1384-20130603/3984_1 /TAXON_ID=29189 /ORGANISM="Ammonia sp." /LENGTH=339 /DNA_ID=CAMNT_0042451401 /DNA_START=64 /DNA_END=1083 /DNA_ORIENTATION=-
MASMPNEEEKKSNSDAHSTCLATQNYDAKKKLYYCEKDITLTAEHMKMYNELRQFVDDVLARKIPWELSVLDPKIVALVDKDPSSIQHTEQKQTDANQKEYATEAMYQYLVSWATEITLIRAITGSDYRLEISKIALLETVQWRVNSKVDEITPDMFEAAIKTKVVYSTNQRDKKGHIICYFKILETPPEDPWVIVRAAIWTIEKGVRMADQKGVHQIMWLADIEHLKYATVPPLQILKQIARILQYYYPERLYRAFVLYSPWVFRMVWKMISGLLTENTKGKIIVPGWYESAEYDTFKEHVEKDQLYKRFGGTLEMQYSYEWEVQQFQQTNGYKDTEQ